MKLSVLLPVYKNDVPSQVQEAILSLLQQTVPAEKILVLVDGPISDELCSTLEKMAAFHPSVELHLFPQNRGLPTVLNEGLRLARTEWVIRMDADDISLPKRFELQTAFIQQNPTFKLVGGQINEFSDDPKICSDARQVPLTHDKIVKFARFRNPFNHPTVAYHRETLLSLQGYDEKMISFEDYDLWVRILQAGHQTGNLPDILVSMRTGGDFMSRRSGKTYFKRELAFLKSMRAHGFIGSAMLLLLMLTRLPLRLLPAHWLKLIYQKALRHS